MANKTYEYLVLGIKHISYVNKQGKQIEGNKLFLLNQLEEIDFGQSCEDVYLSQNVYINGLQPNMECNLVYNRYGAVVSVDFNTKD